MDFLAERKLLVNKKKIYTVKETGDSNEHRKILCIFRTFKHSLFGRQHKAKKYDLLIKFRQGCANTIVIKSFNRV